MFSALNPVIHFKLATTCLFLVSSAAGIQLITDTQSLRTAVSAWCSNPTNATSTYGHISTWDTSGVNDTSYLFGGVLCDYRSYGSDPYDTNDPNCPSSISGHDPIYSEYLWGGGYMYYVPFGVYCSTFQKFNDAISSWKTSRVVSMSRMFAYASTFDGDLGEWDTGQVVDMSGMFMSCLYSCGSNFTGKGLLNWDTSQVTTMTAMFSYASAFNQPLSTWDGKCWCYLFIAHDESKLFYCRLTYVCHLLCIGCIIESSP